MAREPADVARLIFS